MRIPGACCARCPAKKNRNVPKPLADRPERATLKKKTVVPDSIARACAAETAAVSRETGGKAPARGCAATTGRKPPEGEGTKTGGHDRSDG